MVFYPPSADKIADVMRSKGYVVFTNERGYDLNLFGIRTKDIQSNRFNDWVGTMYMGPGGVWIYVVFPATTDPGLYWREYPMNVKGTAILKPGQYRSAYQLGTHRAYRAFQQIKPVTVYRDVDRDSYLDFDDNNTDIGVFGINIHRASMFSPSSDVNRWSAGCQVLQDTIHLNFLLALAEESAAIYGNKFTYTLLTEADFD